MIILMLVAVVSGILLDSLGLPCIFYSGFMEINRDDFSRFHFEVQLGGIECFDSFIELMVTNF